MKGPNELSKGPAICDDSKIKKIRFQIQCYMYKCIKKYLNVYQIVKIKCLLNKMGRVPCMHPFHV